MLNIFENILFALLNWRFFLKFSAFYIKKLVANNFDGGGGELCWYQNGGSFSFPFSSEISLVRIFFTFSK